MLENSGLQDIIVRPYRMKKLEQAIGEIKMSGLVPPLKGFYKLTLSYLTKPAYRKAVNDMVRDATAIPRHFMKYYGYGIYAGRKSL